jgi:hypothetical protein
MVFAVCAIFLFAGILSAQVSTTTNITGFTPSAPVLGQNVTITAQVTPAAATGSVMFMDGANVLGLGPLNGSGIGSLNIISLPAGVHSIRAVYGGVSGSFLPSQSSSQTRVVIAYSGAGFQTAVNYGAGSGAFSVAMGDFNGDAIADLAVANFSSNNVSVLMGTGSGAFQAPTNFGAGGGPFAVTVGDFNGDGLTDLAVANFNGSTASVLLGNGNGTFQSACQLQHWQRVNLNRRRRLQR